MISGQSQACGVKATVLDALLSCPVLSCPIVLLFFFFFFFFFFFCLLHAVYYLLFQCPRVSHTHARHGKTDILEMQVDNSSSDSLWKETVCPKPAIYGVRRHCDLR